MSRPATSPLVHDALEPGAVVAAVEALRQGHLIVFPTETVYGVGCNAASAEALAKLAAAIRDGSKPSAWHAPDASVAVEVFKPASPIHKRLFDKLLPGPVTFIVERSEGELDSIRSRLKVRRGALDDGRTIGVRVPDHPVAAALLDQAFRAGMPVAAQGIGAAGWGDGRVLSDDMKRGEVRDVGAVLSDGPTRLARSSTTVRLLASGGYRIEREGAMPTKTIQQRAQRTILFVCSGNTCRSPMAQAIALHELAARSAGAGPVVPVNIVSAGTSAYDGDAATRETIDAVKSIGIDPSPLTRHRSKGLTARMIDDAEVIYGMTANHVRAALSLAPEAAGKTKVLDPEGEDVPDPIGGSLEVYTRTARRLQELIRRRLAEAD